jgi:predicted  nucleic acid-binding Zn-ribbon protein
MRECEGCGSPVSDRFARVFDDNQGEVHACPECGVQGHYGAVGGQP